MVVIDLVRITVLVLVSMLVSPGRLPARSWRTEFIFRLAKRLLSESVGKPFLWMRVRQKLLQPFSLSLLKVTKTNRLIEGVPCLIFEPKKASPGTLIIYLHGGGYVIGSSEYYRTMLAKLALDCEAEVVGVDYRLAPEHAIPAAHSDCISVVKSLASDPKNSDRKIILMGDSAGGGLCLATLVSDECQQMYKKVDASVLISPWLVATNQDLLELKHEASDILDQKVLSYWSKTAVVNSESAALLDVMNVDFNKLPPLYIQTGGAEVFSKQVSQFVARLEEAGHPYEYETFDQQFHVFQTLTPLVKEADAALNRIEVFLRPYTKRENT
mgnify:CR=1 FL=1